MPIRVSRTYGVGGETEACVGDGDCRAPSDPDSVSLRHQTNSMRFTGAFGDFSRDCTDDCRVGVPLLSATYHATSARAPFPGGQARGGDSVLPEMAFPDSAPTLEPSRKGRDYRTLLGALAVCALISL